MEVRSDNTTEHLTTYEVRGEKSHEVRGAKNTEEVREAALKYERCAEVRALRSLSGFLCVGHRMRSLYAPQTETES